MYHQNSVLLPQIMVLATSLYILANSFSYPLPSCSRIMRMSKMRHLLLRLPSFSPSQQLYKWLSPICLRHLSATVLIILTQSFPFLRQFFSWMPLRGISFSGLQSESIQLSSELLSQSECPQLFFLALEPPLFRIGRCFRWSLSMVLCSERSLPIFLLLTYKQHLDAVESGDISNFTQQFQEDVFSSNSFSQTFWVETQKLVSPSFCIKSNRIEGMNWNAKAEAYSFTYFAGLYQAIRSAFWTLYAIHVNTIFLHFFSKGRIALQLPKNATLGIQAVQRPAVYFFGRFFGEQT